jgi:predicted  nucleic acid-binding Zn-ribbon protein
VNTRKEDGSYIQCLNCGEIYSMERNIPISVSVVKSHCPKCGWNKGLNCGDKKEDIYYFYDPVMDRRYY